MDDCTMRLESLNITRAFLDRRETRGCDGPRPAAGGAGEFWHNHGPVPRQLSAETAASSALM